MIDFFEIVGNNRKNILLQDIIYADKNCLFVLEKSDSKIFPKIKNFYYIDILQIEDGDLEELLNTFNPENVEQEFEYLVFYVNNICHYQRIRDFYDYHSSKKMQKEYLCFNGTVIFAHNKFE